MQLSGIETWVASLQSKAAAFYNRTENQVIAALVDFRDKRGQLNFQLTKLKKNAPAFDAPAALKADYTATLALANDAKAKADWIGRIADEFTNITGLGLLPAVIAGATIPVLLAGAAAVVAIIYTVTNAVSKYVGAKQIADAAKASGGNPQTALERFYASQKGTGIIGDTAQLIWPVAIAGVAYLMLTGKRR